MLGRFDRILVPEVNMGQLALLLEARNLPPVERLNKVRGLPFGAGEIERRIRELTGGKGR